MAENNNSRLEQLEPLHLVPTCLICRDELLKTPSETQTEDLSADVFAELFRIFCMYMEWGEIPPDKAFQFQSEQFPFCKPCRADLRCLYDVSESLRAIWRRIQSLTSSATTKILRSSGQEIRSSSGGYRKLSKNGSDERPYNGEKVEFHRNLTIKKFLPSVWLKAGHSENERVDTVPEEDLRRENTPEPEDILSEDELYAGNVDSESEKNSVELIEDESDHPRVPVTTEVEVVDLEEEVEKPIQQIVKISNNSSRFPMAFSVEVSKGKFEYRGFYFRKSPDGGFKCDHCDFNSRVKNNTTTHILKQHYIKSLRKEKSKSNGGDGAKCRGTRRTRSLTQKIGENTYRYRGFMFQELPGPRFQCCHCRCSAWSKNYITMHILNKHNKRGNSDASSILPEDTDDNVYDKEGIRGHGSPEWETEDSNPMVAESFSSGNKDATDGILGHSSLSVGKIELNVDMEGLPSEEEEQDFTGFQHGSVFTC